ncbi:MAG: hypothetical protein H6766_05635 [Candidatus Peribacteria bacterium]|nr:MAG: hypothetical protein H6766_05635 [Candidatus Peribacteria bacterium]
MALDNIPIDTITQSGKDEDGRKKLLEAMLYDIFSEERIASAHKRTFSYQEMEKKVEMVCSIIKENIDKNDIRDLVE